MASLVLGTIGSVIGGPVGYLVGAAIGSIIDNQLNKQKVQGPRISDRRVQSSAYGEMIPIVHGSMAVAGNLIWAADFEERSDTEEEGGFKGGPVTEVTTYSYFCSFAVSLCEGEIDSISRIWANGRLWYDANGSSIGFTDWRLYRGDESQLPDPTIEAHLGAGNVPAYRGQAYIVFTSLPLEPFGNALPMLLFEVNKHSSITSQTVTLKSVATSGDEPSRFIFGSDGAAWANGPMGGFEGVRRIDPFTGATLSTWNVVPLSATLRLTLPISGGRFWGSNASETVLTDPNARTIKNVWQMGMPHTGGNLIRELGTATTIGDDLLMMHRILFEPFNRWEPLRVAPDDPMRTGQPTVIARGPLIGGSNYRWPDQTLQELPSQIQGWQHGYGATDGQYYYALAVTVDYNPPIFNQGPYRIHRFDVNTLALISQHDVPLTSGFYARGFSLLLYRGFLYVGADGGRIDKWDPATMTFLGSASNPEGVPITKWLGLTEDDKIIASGGATVPTGHGTVNAIILDPNNFSPSGFSYAYVPQPNTSGQSAGLGLYQRDPVTKRLLGVSWESPNATVFRIASGIDASRELLSVIVADYCQRVALPPARIDTSQLLQTVHGALLARQVSAREAIEPLANAFFFDGVESDAKVKFVPRGLPIVATIPVDDLAITSDDTAPRVDIQRGQDVELPRTVNLNFFEASRDYQAGSQYERRLGGFSSNDVTVEIPVAMNADEAKAIVQSQIYNAWAERNRYSFATSVKYSALEPTDLVEVDGIVMRLNKRSEEGLLLRWEGTGDASQIYVQSGDGAQGEGGQQSPPIAHGSDVVLLDIPLLRDGDDRAGFYSAANGFPPAGWGGVQVYKSIDHAASWIADYSITTPSTLGFTADVLATYDVHNNIFDELHTVTVDVNGALSSITELQALNGGNRCMVGAECLHFKVATLVTAGRYVLSGLLRGRLGTEWAAGTHAAGERFVLLGNGVQNVVDPASDIGIARDYNGVTIGLPLELGTRQVFTNNGVRHEPYAPVQMGGGRTPGNDWLIVWARRTRWSDGWQDYIDAPLSETVEAYEVDIMSGTTVKRTITSSVPSCTYTAAQQTTDFGSTQASISVRVYQLSSVTGRGYAGVATLPSVASVS